MFRFDGQRWVEEEKLLPSDGGEGESFGQSVAIAEDIVVIGMPFDNDNGQHSGSVFVFRFDGQRWIEEAKLLPSDGNAQDRFGYSVAVAGDTMLVGAQGGDDNGEDSGSAYVFRYYRSRWIEEYKLVASDGAENDRLGQSVTLCDDTGWVGAPWAANRYGGGGSAYGFAVGWGSCAGTERIEAKCSRRGGGRKNRLNVKVKEGLPGETLTLRLDDNGRLDERVSLGCKGRGRVKLNRRIPSGRHSLELTDCGVGRTVKCP